MSKPTTFLDVFNAALAEIDDPGKVRQLQIQWERVHAADRVAELTELAMAHEYFPGRVALTIGGDARGEARLVEDPDDDHHRRYRVTLFCGRVDRTRYVDTVDQAKALTVFQYHAEERGMDGLNDAGAERVGQ